MNRIVVQMSNGRMYSFACPEDEREEHWTAENMVEAMKKITGYLPSDQGHLVNMSHVVAAWDEELSEDEAVAL